MTQTNKPVWRTIAFYKHVSLQYAKTTFLKQTLYLRSLYFSQNMLVPVVCICYCFEVWLYEWIVTRPMWLARVMTTMQAGDKTQQTSKIAFETFIGQKAYLS